PIPRPASSLGASQPTSGPPGPLAPPPGGVGAAPGGRSQPDPLDPATPPAADDEDEAHAEQGRRDEQTADIRAQHVHAAEEDEEAAEDGLPAPAATGDGAHRRDEQEGDPEAEGPEPV